jgi:hypothetical protein
MQVLVNLLLSSQLGSVSKPDLLGILGILGIGIMIFDGVRMADLSRGPSI